MFKLLIDHSANSSQIFRANAGFNPHPRSSPMFSDLGMKVSVKLKLRLVASSHMVGLTNQEIQLTLAYHKLGNVDLTLFPSE